MTLRDRIREWIVLIILIAAGYAVFTLGLAPRLAHGHEWYPRDCCSGTECYEISAADVEPVPGGGWRIKRTGEVFHQSDGWTTYGGESHPRIRVSPPEAGGTYHRCSFRNGDPNANTICIFVPPIGF